MGSSNAEALQDFGANREDLGLRLEWLLTPGPGSLIWMMNGCRDGFGDKQNRGRIPEAMGIRDLLGLR